MKYADNLLEWFQMNQRDMPWRRTKDPYCIWISEVMLQQTQVVTVIPYYLRFIERFPTPSALAAATLEEVHNYWQGLGYYRRGENLWKGAKLIEEKWQGRFPTDPVLIKEIPGIGPYTLGAICSIAYGIALPAVDGNVMRVLSRQFEIGEDIGNSKSRSVFEDKVMALMPKDCGSFNQALMELGALVCTPKNPACSICPMQAKCLAYMHETQLNFPVKEKKIKKQEEHYKALLIQKGNQFILEKRPEEGLLANLWGIPLIEAAAWEKSVLRTLEHTELEQVTHVFTHKKWYLSPIILNWSQKLEQELKNMGITTESWRPIAPAALKDYPIGTAFMKVIKAWK